MRTKINFIFFLILCAPATFFVLNSCGESKDEKKVWDFKRPERIEESYWNNYRITQKVLESCKGIYFPDYFPMSDGYAKLVKKIIPNDTILFYDLEMQKISRNNLSPLYFFIDKKTKELFYEEKSPGDIPLLTGIFACDSNQNFFYQGSNLTRKGRIRKPEDIIDSTGARVLTYQMRITPCLNSAAYKELQKENWEFAIKDSVVYDTLRFNRMGAEINPILEKEYLAKIKSKRVRTNENVNLVLEAVETHPCIKMEILFVGEENGFFRSPVSVSKNYTIWLERNIGPVKIECKETGIIYFLGKKSGYGNPSSGEYSSNTNFGRY